MKIIELFENGKGITISLLSWILACDELFILSVIAEQSELSLDQKKKLKRLVEFLEN